MIRRRAFLTGLGSLLAAPAIVHAGNLMPVKVMIDSPYPEWLRREGQLIEFMEQRIYYGNPFELPIQFQGFRSLVDCRNDFHSFDPSLTPATED